MPRFLLPILLGAVALSALCAGVEALARRGPLRGERGRKAVHVLGGTVTAALPLWLTATEVVVLAVGMLVAFALSRRWRVLRSLHGDTERGVGELLFCAAVALVAAAVGVGAAFVAAVLTLSYADPAAALAGHRYGGRRLPGALAGKTWAGSASCALVTVVVLAAVLGAAEVPTSLASPAGVLGVLVLGAATAVAEAVPRKGWDNVTVPVTVALGWVLLLGA